MDQWSLNFKGEKILETMRKTNSHSRKQLILPLILHPLVDAGEKLSAAAPLFLHPSICPDFAFPGRDLIKFYFLFAISRPE